MAVELSLPGLVDLRQPILGDSFNWAGVEPTAAKKSVVFHHSASPDTQDAFDFANYHVMNNGWGGIGYHFVITSKNYPGRAPFTQPGAQIQYAGDLGTWRAHVVNQNPGRIGVCFSGYEPDEEQLKLARQLMKYFVAPNNILPSINFMNQATVHQLVFEQSTACPGTTFPTWLPYLQGGAWPYAAPTPPPAPVTQPAPPVAVAPETPTVSDMTPGKGGDIPEYEATYHTAREDRTILRPGGEAVDIITGNRAAIIPIDTVVNIAGYFTYKGVHYARTVYSVTHNLWNGVDVTFFDAPTGQVPDTTIPVTVVPPDQVQSNVTDAQIQAATVPEPRKLSLWELIIEWVAKITAAHIKQRKS